MTVTTSVAPALVEPATATPFPYGLFSVVPFRASADGRWQGGVIWETNACGQPLGVIGPFNCEDPSATVGLPKDLSHTLQTGEATPFTVYGSFKCSPAGWPPATAQSKATERLNTREEYQAEWAVWTGDLGNVPNFEADATDLGGGGVLTPSAGLALLEDWLSDFVGSLGVIHMSRGVAEVLLGRQLLKATGSSLTTQVGTPVVAGSGYPDTGPGGAGGQPGEAWIMASPPMFGYRSEVFTSSGRAGDLLDRGTNDMLAIAERTYLYGYDPCGVGAVKIALPDVEGAPVSDPQTTVTLSIGTQPGSPVPEGTDVTVTVQANVAPSSEVNLHARLNGGPWTDLGEMTEVNPQEFVYNQQTTGASGDTYDLFATSGSATSPTITVAVS
jgi:hypothetical protein